MENNFREIKKVMELKNANSYGERLYHYMGQKNQIEWVIEKIKKNPYARSTTITTFEPLTDFSYIPCISLLDFDVTDNKLNLYVYARALDFGNKACANFICLFDILEYVAHETNMEIGNINIIMKSAHIYLDDIHNVNKILES